MKELKDGAKNGVAMTRIERGSYRVAERSICGVRDPRVTSSTTEHRTSEVLLPLPPEPLRQDARTQSHRERAVEIVCTQAAREADGSRPRRVIDLVGKPDDVL